MSPDRAEWSQYNAVHQYFGHESLVIKEKRHCRMRSLVTTERSNFRHLAVGIQVVAGNTRETVSSDLRREVPVWPGCVWIIVQYVND